jgi:dipeptidyl-peptidase-3
MKKNLFILLISVISFSIAGCSGNKTEDTKTEEQKPFEYISERFADVQILRYQVPGFEELTAQQKELSYYLYEAALVGRDMIWDQKYKHNLRIRRTLENIWETYKGDRTTNEFKQFEIYTKRVWFSNGIHHHYASDKIIPEFPASFLVELINNSDISKMPWEKEGDVEGFISFLTPILFDPNVDGKTVNLEAGIDNVVGSANNFYEDITQKEVEDYYAKLVDPKDPTPVSHGLNSKLMKINGKIVEKTWKVGGMYSKAIEQIVFWLDKAAEVAENEQQRKALALLSAYYQTGDLRTFDDYNIAWVNDVNSTIDVVNGFIEVYQDALGKRGSYESVVSIKDFEATKKIEIIAQNAQWFEDNAPLMDNHKKKEVKGIIGKSINVIIEGGDAAPTTPIGINLPNSDWIRREHGSKSVALGNIVNAYNIASASSPSTGEFSLNDETKERAKKYGNLAAELHTDMHEVIGHASGQLEPGIAPPDVTLKNYQNTLEEARADLVALYYIYDQKLIDIGVMPSLEVGKTEYESYLLNGLMLQLNRLDLGKSLEEAHMRNRQIVAKWVYEKGAKDKVVELVKRDGNTFVQINDYEKLRSLFGDLLREIQRIKSQGDFKAGQALVENYGVKVDAEIHKEVKERFAKLNVAAYKGFIQPRLVPIEKDGKIVDVKIEYPDSFADQMMEYAKKYSFLPNVNY